ncbi:MAG: serine/threonine-protein kinase PknK [bacterium]|nr:serine/threonine-protein kinase PknK [bacterium]
MKGYQNPEKIYESAQSLVFRAIKEQNNQPVILKILNNNSPAPEEILEFNREYELTAMFTNRGSAPSEGVIGVYEISKIENSPVIVMEDIGARSLAEILKSMKLYPDKFLDLAVRIAKIIGNIHKRNIIHKDINPSNIIWNIEKDILRIIDFGIATELPREITSVKNPNVLVGTIAYISPEQTGRMNRSLDYRTDFYSLGVTFYWMLSGRLPFESHDLLELVHSHIAVMPVSPHEIDEKIPEPISKIIMKLMTKNAEDRYLSAHGLKADLERCKKELRDTGAISPFELATHDVSDKFQIPQKLYGRKQEISTLMSAFERVNKGGTELMLVSGFSGIGKSVLINEIQKPIVKHSGYFISGKFERLKKDVPYSAIIQAFTGLAKQVLSEGEDNITEWKKRIVSALGPNGKIVTGIIPLIEVIIGKQSEVPTLGPVESQNRFNLVFQEFIKILANKEHPLVLFLDDLQWADLASLHLLKLFTSDPDIHHLFIIGAYRHNETPHSHPLTLALKEIKKTGAVVNTISLQPLNAEHIGQLLADTLNHPTEETKSPAELLIRKTGGNPFFVNKLLQSLYKECLIDFSFEHGWLWQQTGIEKMPATDTVVDLMAEEITGFSENAQEMLKLGACIGNSFTLSIMLAVCEKPEYDILSALNEILQDGILNIIDDIYTFSHDRVQEAAYSLIPDEEKRQLHYRIGNLELMNRSTEELPENIFYIVNQLNAGADLVAEEFEKFNLAGLNLMAGEKALASNAYASALNYLKAGIDLLSRNSWQKNYAITLELYREAAAAAQLSADYETMEKLAQEIVQNARSILDTIKVHETRIFASIARYQAPEGIRIGLDVLKKLGHRLPEKPGTIRIIYELLSLKLSLFGKPVKNLVNLPEMKDPHKLAVMQILTGIGSAAYYTTPELLPLVIINSVRLSVKYGNCDYSPYSYAGYGMIHCGVLGDSSTGYEYGELALNLVEKFNIVKTRSRVWLVVRYFINHWKKPLTDSVHPLLEAYTTGLETGDLEFAALSANAYCCNLLFSGMELTELEKEKAKYIRIIRKLNQDTILNFQLMTHQTVLNLRGMSNNPCELIGSSYDEKKMLPEFIKTKNGNALANIYFYLLQLNYIFENNTKALNYAELVQPYTDEQISNPIVPIIYFYDSLTRLAQKKDSKKHLKKAGKNQKKMKKWAFHAPMNYRHKYHLVEAEIARVRGQKLKALDLYNRAVTLAHENKFIQDEALALELTAKFRFELNDEGLAAYYIQKARHAYQLWGAAAKVAHIEKKYRSSLADN